MYRNLINKTINKIIPVFFLSFILLCSISGCKMSGDALAEYNGGKITRGQMYEWLEVRGISKDATIKKKAIQKSKLRQIVLDTLTTQEAVKNGYDKNDEFQKKLNELKRTFYASYMQKNLSEKGKFNEEAVSVRLIKFNIQNTKIVDKKNKELTGQELADAIKLKKDAAVNAIKEYESGAKFEDLAKKYSQDYTNKNGGFLGYITRDMREPDFTNAVFKMNKGEYTKEPIKAGNAFYIVLVEDKTNFTNENIETFFKDKTNSAAIKRRVAAKGVTSHVEKLKQEKDVVINYDAIEKGNLTAVIYKVGDKSLTLKDLNSYAEKIYDKSKNPDQKPLDNKLKKDLAERFLTEELLARDLISSNLDKSESFVKEWSYYYARTLSTEYKNSKVAVGIIVTDQEIKEEYEKNKNRSYVKREMKGKAMVQSFYPFNEIKEKIKQMMFNKKKMQAERKWEEKLLSDNSFKINEDELEGK